MAPSPPARSTRQPMADRTFLITLACICVGALVLRIAFVVAWYSHRTPGGDAYYFFEQAKLVADGKGFIDPYAYFKGHHAVRASAYHPPVVVAFLTVVNWLGFQSLRSQLIATSLIGTGTVALVGLIGRRVARPWVGLLAATIAAVYPNLWINDGMMMSEGIYAFAVAVTLYFAYRAWSRASWADILATAAAATVAGLTRTEAFLLLPLLLVPLILGRRQHPLATRLKMLAGAAVVAVVVVSPWIVYNHGRFHRRVLVSTNGGPTLAVTNCHSTYNGLLFGYWDQSCILPPTPQPPKRADESDVDAFFRKRGLRYARHHLGDLPRVVLAREGRMFNVFRVSQSAQIDATVEGRGGGHGQGVVWWGYGMYWAMLPLAVLGVLGLRRRLVPVYPLLLTFVTAAFVAATVYGTTRFRAAAEVALVVLAACGIEWIVSTVVNRRRRRSQPVRSDPASASMPATEPLAERHAEPSGVARVTGAPSAE